MVFKGDVLTNPAKHQKHKSNMVWVCPVSKDDSEKKRLSIGYDLFLGAAAVSYDTRSGKKRYRQIR